MPLDVLLATQCVIACRAAMRVSDLHIGISDLTRCERAQMHTELKNSKRLMDLYHRALTIQGF